MQIMFALAERRGYPISENWPELIAAVDEGTDGDNPAYYPAQVELARGSWGTEMGDVRHFVVDLPDDVMRQAFRPTTVTAKPRHTPRAGE